MKGRGQLTVTAHALTRASQRFGVEISVGWLRSALPKAPKLYHSSAGAYVLLRLNGRLAVAVVKDQTIGGRRERCLVTIVTIGQAFANCPKAVFLALLEVGELLTAMQLRRRWTIGRAPAAIGEGVSATSFPAKRADAVWQAFRHVSLRRR